MEENKKVVIENAIYTEQLIREYQGNPLIEALPDIIATPQRFVELTTYIPEIRAEDRNLPLTYRAHMLDNISNFFKPLSYHIEVEQKISRMIRYGYLSKNPYKDRKIKQGVDGLKYGMTMPDSSTVAELGIFGISGMGKTTLINKVLSLYPQLILHTDYKGDKTVRYQIPWIKVETPSGCRIKSLSLNILNEIDNLFGEINYYKKADNKKEYEQIQYLKNVFDIHSVGLLVIDEIQNIRGIASKESDKIMRFFVELSNVINVPIVLIGTLKALPLFATEMKNSRRIADSKPMYKSQNDREWNVFIKTLFKLQWTKHPVEASDDLIDTLYEESQGITDIAIKLFTFAQLRAMYTGGEKITKSIIKSVASDSLIPLRPLLKALKSNNEKELMKYEDLYDSTKFFKDFSKQEKDKINLHEQYMVEDDIQIGSSEEFNVIKGITSFLIQAGYTVKQSEKAAKDTVKKHGANIDISLLKRYSYESLMLENSPSDIGTPSANEKKDLPEPKPKSKRKNKSDSGMLKVHANNSDKDKDSGYDALKKSNYISSDDEFI